MKTKSFTCTALVCALVCLPAFRAGAATTDTKLLDAARAAQPAVIQSLHDMVMIESGSDDSEGLEKMAKYCTDRLDALGATTEMVPRVNGKHPGLVKGVFKGNGKLRVMLIAHMDTVYHRGILETEPYRREGNKLYGPGIADDKGGIAVILHALEILKQQGWRDYRQVTVLFDPDEEVGSPGSGPVIARLAADQDVVLSYEPSPAKEVAKKLTGTAAEGLLLQTAGTGEVKIIVQGRAAHAGSAPEQGRNALVELADLILKTHDVAKDIPGMQMNWTTASAGKARNQIPDHAEVGGDVRITNPEGPDKLLTALRSKIAEPPLVPDTTATVSLELLRPMYKADAGSMQLARLAKSIYGELHEGDLLEQDQRYMPGGQQMAYSGRNLILVPGTMGGTDAGYAQSGGNAAVLESFGLAGWGYHAKNEYIEIDSIVPRLYLTSRMLIELGKRAHQGTAPGEAKTPPRVD